MNLQVITDENGTILAWEGTQADAKRTAKEMGGTASAFDVPVNKEDLLEFLRKFVIGMNVETGEFEGLGAEEEEEEEEEESEEDEDSEDEEDEEESEEDEDEDEEDEDEEDEEEGEEEAEGGSEEVAELREEVVAIAEDLDAVKEQFAAEINSVWEAIKKLSTGTKTEPTKTEPTKAVKVEKTSKNPDTTIKSKGASAAPASGSARRAGRR